MYFGVIILRVPQGLDYSQIIEDEDSPITMNGNETNITQTTEDKPGQSTANQLTQGRSTSVTCLISLHNKFTIVFTPSHVLPHTVFVITVVQTLARDQNPSLMSLGSSFLHPCIGQTLWQIVFPLLCLCHDMDNFHRGELGHLPHCHQESRPFIPLTL